MSSDLIAKWKACGQNKSDLNYENKLADFYNVFRNSLFFLEIVPIPEEGAGECLRFIPIPDDADNPVILPAYSTANENQAPANILGMMQGTERDFTPATGDFILSIVDKYSFSLSIINTNNESVLISKDFVVRLAEISIKIKNGEKELKEKAAKKFAFIILPLIVLMIIIAGIFFTH
ncbi:hypothetical protein EYY99_02160 [Hafnia alvei]|uniref:hypothetical protein n=1 Tax=Hafnia alvei TaxID=569 RepID=UPI000DFF8C73|nr:hypothetical protein [Hafnia alvei]TBL47344.1 hypothetical protein EYY99_02160 [Hafnia alvei]STQ69136.1 Uncharacterised protein [Hafnia alvei]